ncbi:hypothetical protein FRB90_001693 [Tulasnella sp. 427]|nr:hypothetical protein FRB90_001693 [Tulasnella sp. 427]
MSTANDQYDLLIVTDATASMGVFLTSLNESIPEIIALSTMSGAFKRLGIIAYRDYCDNPILEWSGWNPTDLNGFARNLRPSGGGDYPEAAKTGLIKALDEVDASGDTLVLWYTDAPPHHPSQKTGGSRNPKAEKLAFPDRSTDWMHLVYEAKAKRCTVFSFLSDARSDRSFYTLLSQVTGGACIEGNWYDSKEISKLTLNILLTWMGNPPEPETTANDKVAMSWVYRTVPPQEIGNMTEVESADYLPRIPKSNRDSVDQYLQQMRSTRVSFTVNDIPQSKVRIDQTSLARRFANPAEGEYRAAVYSALASIIDQNVVALTYNPVFGQLWRAVCKYRGPSTIPGEKAVPPRERDELVTAFSLKVGKISDPQQEQTMKDWLENSYDSSEMIQEVISVAPDLETCSWMYIDLDSFGEGGVNLTRIELMDASRSCAASVMAQLAKIFTHCKNVDPATYQCTGCTTKLRKTIEEVECTLRQVTDENGAEWLGVKKNSDVFTKKSAFKLVQAHTAAFFTLSEPSTTAPLVLHSKPILDVPAVVKTVFDRVNAGTVELGTCTLCFESAPHEKLRPACGRSGCAHRLDEECLKSWYGANRVGHLLNAMQLLCPFCRRTPARKVMTKYNPQAAALGGLKDAMEDRGFYFAWCEDCGFAKRAVERACCDGNRLPNIRNFVCEECQETRRPAGMPPVVAEGESATTDTSNGPRFTACPQCGVMVEKTYGCNHITCVCGAHFCHVCGFGGDEGEIYDHMSKAHGSIYDDDGYDSDY